MSSTNKKLFEYLPQQLKNFFHKYPPTVKYSSKPTSTLAPEANPFLPNKHPVTGRWHEPKYSLRRMSVLYKLSYRFGIQDLLPPTNSRKLFFEEKYNNKKFMKGVLSPKGHKYELERPAKLQRMADAIKNADKFILGNKGMKYKKRVEEKKDKSKISWF
ncbi:hypothetical protein ACO0RG_000274 [Hanseniaspora osmophila]|uniref:54S ribosomal protein L25, mitochondrial n=1 Tax=Hanseniaspora osmophila TaxID=56408 RepID=A0A1E5R502_9ASCO|nr:54S ribosomal protein L25, mitochondrial [Hanseniaspora osmophila]